LDKYPSLQCTYKLEQCTSSNNIGSDSRQIVHMMKFLLNNFLEVETDDNLDWTQQNRNRKRKHATRKGTEKLNTGKA
jgi:hypothetical protein